MRWMLFAVAFMWFGLVVGTGCGSDGDGDADVETGLCSDFPLRNEALLHLEEQVEQTRASASEERVDATVVHLSINPVATAFFEYELIEQRTEIARIINSQAELEAEPGVSNFGTMITDEVVVDWQSESLVLALGWPGQYVYSFGLHGDAVTMYAGHLDPCGEYDPEDLRLYYSDEPMFIRVPKVESLVVVQLSESYRFVEVRASGECERGPADPVLDRVGGAPFVTGGDGQYRMWYGGYSAMTGNFFETSSEDGITWTPDEWDDTHLSAFDEHSPYAGHYRASVVEATPGELWMFYTDEDFEFGGRQVIARSESSDGVTWSGEVEVLAAGEPGEWDEGSVSGAVVIEHEGTYWMWYTGKSPGDRSTSIGLATSQDGVEWTRHPENPVLMPGEPGSFDDLSVGAPVVLHDGDRFLMWYTASTGGGDAARAQDVSIGLATSPDGATWERQDAPVLSVAAGWETNGVQAPAALLERGGATVWYTGVNDRGEPSIGRATCALPQ